MVYCKTICSAWKMCKSVIQRTCRKVRRALRGHKTPSQESPVTGQLAPYWPVPGILGLHRRVPRVLSSSWTVPGVSAPFGQFQGHCCPSGHLPWCWPHSSQETGREADMALRPVPPVLAITWPHSGQETGREADVGGRGDLVFCYFPNSVNFRVLILKLLFWLTFYWFLILFLWLTLCSSLKLFSWLQYFDYYGFQIILFM